MSFWKRLFSGDNSKTNFMFVIGFLFAAPFAALAFGIIIWHTWVIQKPMDSETVKLLLGVLGIASGGAGASMFSRTTWSQTLLQGGQVFKKGPRPTGGGDVANP